MNRDIMWRPGYSSSVSMLSSCYLDFFRYTPASNSYTLSLHDALPISSARVLIVEDHPVLRNVIRAACESSSRLEVAGEASGDRKSTRLNSSHRTISYAVFCLKKKKEHDVTVVVSFQDYFVTLTTYNHY